MAEAKNRYLAKRWLQTAAEDLAAARTLYDHEMYAASCFHSQQAGEKSIKAIWFFEDEDPWGHSVKKLVDEFPKKDDFPDLAEVNNFAALLDKYYIPTRYPNGLPDLTPGQVYIQSDAAVGLVAASGFIELCKTWIESNLRSK
ncbi:MAG: HEPN domain-containing protein [Desulfomonilaceae bacterium]|jgi:HEPN domain-containing protein